MHGVRWAALCWTVGAASPALAQVPLDEPPLREIVTTARPEDHGWQFLGDEGLLVDMPIPDTERVRVRLGWARRGSEDVARPLLGQVLACSPDHCLTSCELVHFDSEERWPLPDDRCVTAARWDGERYLLQWRESGGESLVFYDPVARTLLNRLDVPESVVGFTCRARTQECIAVIFDFTGTERRVVGTTDGDFVEGATFEARSRVFARVGMTEDASYVAFVDAARNREPVVATLDASFALGARRSARATGVTVESLNTFACARERCFLGATSMAFAGAHDLWRVPATGPFELLDVPDPRVPISCALDFCLWGEELRVLEGGEGPALPTTFELARPQTNLRLARSRDGRLLATLLERVPGLEAPRPRFRVIDASGRPTERMLSVAEDMHPALVVSTGPRLGADGWLVVDDEGQTFVVNERESGLAIEERPLRIPLRSGEGGVVHAFSDTTSFHVWRRGGDVAVVRGGPGETSGGALVEFANPRGVRSVRAAGFDEGVLVATLDAGDQLDVVTVRDDGWVGPRWALGELEDPIRLAMGSGPAGVLVVTLQGYDRFGRDGRPLDAERVPLPSLSDVDPTRSWSLLGVEGERSGWVVFAAGWVQLEEEPTIDQVFMMLPITAAGVPDPGGWRRLGSVRSESSSSPLTALRHPPWSSGHSSLGSRLAHGRSVTRLGTVMDLRPGVLAPRAVLSHHTDDGGLGSPCAHADECGSGFCIEGACCNAACGDACSTCLASEGAMAEGRCGPRREGSVCRETGAGACDVAEVCDGDGRACPPDVPDPTCLDGGTGGDGGGTGRDGGTAHDMGAPDEGVPPGPGAVVTSGCGCQASGTPSAVLTGLALLSVLRRRRRNTGLGGLAPNRR